MVWIKEVMDDRTKSETHKFWEINNIMDAALRILMEAKIATKDTNKGSVLEQNVKSFVLKLTKGTNER
jgi:hypothetical protein